MPASSEARAERFGFNAPARFVDFDQTHTLGQKRCQETTFGFFGRCVGRAVDPGSRRWVPMLVVLDSLRRTYPAVQLHQSLCDQRAIQASISLCIPTPTSELTHAVGYPLTKRSSYGHC